MQRFEFLLKNEKVKSYHRIAAFLILVNLAAFILLAVRTDNYRMRMICFAGTAVIIVLLLIHFFFNALKKNIYQAIALCITVIAWMLLSYWLASGVCIILLSLYLISVKPLKITLSKQDIRYISFPPKNLKWNDLSNVILKDDILTIDFKNNKLLQVEIVDGANRINEGEFNDFCRQQLKENNKSK